MNKTAIAKYSILGTAFFGLFFFIVGLIMALPTYLLWNWIMPIFGLPQLTIWQSLGLLFLCNILFGQKQYNMENLKSQFKKVTKKDILND